MKTNEDYEKLAEILRPIVSDTTPATACDVVVLDNGIELRPAETNYTKTFYHTEVFVDFCRLFDLSNYIFCNNENEGCIARAY